MRRLLLSVFSVAVVLVSTPMFADAIPYANVGSMAPTVPLTAAGTGSITGYFVSANTAGNDYVRLFDVTQNTFSPFVMSSATSTAGQAYSFGSVVQGDVLVFQLVNYALGNSLLASDTAYSQDGLNHTYVTSYTGSAGIPTGTYIAFEDYIGGYDFDYNDDTFVVNNLATSVAATPEPESLFLLGTGLLAGFSLLRRRLIAR